MKKTTILILAAFPTFVFSQETAWTLENCIEYAVRHNLQGAVQEAQNRIYQYDRLEAVGGFLPSLNASSNVYVNFGRGVDPETNTYISTNTLSNAYEIYSSMTLFDGLAQVFRAKRAKINKAMGREELKNIHDQTALAVMEIFFNALYYKGTVELAGKQLAESVANLKKTERMEELGLKSAPDVTEIRAKEAEDRFALTRQTNLYNMEIIKLKEKMNLPPDSVIAISDYKAEPAGRETENALTIYSQALGYLPKALVADKTLKASEMEYKIARGRLFPTLSLSAGISTGFSRMMDGSDYTSFEEQLKNRRGSYIGLSLSIPVFNGFSRLSEVRRSRQRLISVRNRKEETLRQIYGEIEQAVADVNGLVDECVHALKRTIAMQDAHAANLRKYEEGMIEAIEVSTSANRLLNARVEELNANLKYRLKYKLLQYYKGEQLWTSF